MKKYIASTPQAEVIGSALLAYEEAVHYREFQAILKRFDLVKIDAETWYPQQLTLDIQKTIKEQPGGSRSLISIGMKIIETAKFPPMKSLEEALDAFASSYPLNFRYQSPQDVISAHRLSDRHIRVINSSPHSDEMIYGYIYAMIKRFAPLGRRPVVQFVDLNKIDSDDDTLYDVTW